MTFETTSNGVTLPGLYAGEVKQVEGLTPGYIMVNIPDVHKRDNPELYQIARPCFPYGHFFIPQKGSRVWISFEGGNPNAPVWLGVWYPSPDAPQMVDVQAPAQKSMKSASGHMIILQDEDEEDATRLEIRDLENNLNIIEFGNASITIKSKGRINIDAPIVSIAGRLVGPGINRGI